MTNEPEKIVEATATEARAGSKTRANRNVLFVSLAVVIIAFIALLLIYR